MLRYLVKTVFSLYVLWSELFRRERTVGWKYRWETSSTDLAQALGPDLRLLFKEASILRVHSTL